MSSARIVVASAIVCLIATALAPLFAQAAPPAEDVEAAVKEVVRKYVEAREARDPKAIESLLTADADQFVSDGTWRRGRDELVRGMLESSRRTGGRRTITIETVRSLSDDVAIADGRYIQTGLAGGSERAMWTTIVLKRGADGWRIAAIRNMLPTAPAPPARGKAVEAKPAPRAIRYEAEEGPPRDRDAEKRRDYAVLEAALDDLTSPENPEYTPEDVRPRPGEIVIHHKINVDRLDDPGEVSENRVGQDPRPIPAEIREDFRRRNNGPPRSLADFQPANPNIKVRDMNPLVEKGGGHFFLFEEFRKEFPNGWGYVWAYLPGYSRDGQAAILIFEGGAGLGDHGVDWVYSLARKGRRWQVQWRHRHFHE